MIVIVVGLSIGFKHNFRVGGWIPVVVVGGIFLLGDIYNWPYNTAKFIWPVVLIGIGISVLVGKNCEHVHKKNRKYSNFKEDDTSSLTSATTSSDDILNVSAVFGSVNRVVTSKNFRGGEISSVFGGVELNFTKADINGTAVLAIDVIMGGCEIVVPSNWKVMIELTTVMGGVEDKRPVEFLSSGNTGIEKTLILRGACIMGGIEIKSYA
jgi:predicted membrane protein